jgi:hypothetical protein
MMNWNKSYLLDHKHKKTEAKKLNKKDETCNASNDELVISAAW